MSGKSDTSRIVGAVRRYIAVTQFLVFYAPCVRARHHHPGLDQLLAHLISLRTTWVVKLLPSRALVVLAARVLGIALAADPAELTARTWLGRRTEPCATDF